MDLLHRLSNAPAALRPAPLDIAALVGPVAWQRLPAAVRRRFARGHADTHYSGALDLHCSPVGRLFAFFAAVLGGPLTAVRAASVPADVRVYSDARGGIVWERRLHVGGRAGERVVRSTKEAGPNGTLVERTDGGLAMELNVFEEGGVLVFRSRRYFLALGALRLPIPMLLTPGVCRVAHIDEGEGRFRFTLSMVHPWWGTTFHQTGLFADPKELH
jgi:hypothetical protein